MLYIFCSFTKGLLQLLQRNELTNDHFFQAVWLNHPIGGSTGPSNSLLSFDQQEFFVWNTATHFLSRISKAIQRCFFSDGD